MDKINKSVQEIANLSFDETYNIQQVEALTYNPITENLERTTNIQGNASLTISNADTDVASTEVLTKTIGTTSYTKTLSYNAAGDLISVSSWS